MIKLIFSSDSKVIIMTDQRSESLTVSTEQIRLLDFYCFRNPREKYVLIHCDIFNTILEDSGHKLF